MASSGDTTNRQPRSFGSHPVPDLPQVRQGLAQARAEMASAMAAGGLVAQTVTPGLTSDRINYLVGEAPFYQIAGAPANQPVQWIITRSGNAPVYYSDPSQRTDAAGNWSGSGGAWTAALTGFYTITAQVGAWSARTCFTVIPAFPSPSQTIPDLVGITHVGGTYRFAGPRTPFGSVPFLIEGAQQILNTGARRAFFYLTPQYKTSDYTFDNFGPGPISALRDLAQSPPFQTLLAQALDEIVFTAYTFSNWAWIQDRAQGGHSVPFSPQAESAELADLVTYLAQTYPGKQFILKNWEGDWQLQESFDVNAVPTPAQIAEFVTWMQARQAGVVQGRARAGGAASVRHAIEFNLLSHSVRDQPGMLHDVIPQVPSDLVSYSAWETSNQFDTRRMQDAIAFIQGAPGVPGRTVLIGEFGVEHNPPDPNAYVHARSLLQAFQNMSVHAFFWEIFDNGVPVGLIGPNFEHFDAWFALRQALGARNAAAVVHDPSLTNVPPVMNPGQTLPLRVTFTNTGQPWYQSVAYELDLVGPGNALLGEQAWLPRDVPNGAQVTLTFNFTAPSTPGAFRLQLAQHGIELFGEAVSFQVS